MKMAQLLEFQQLEPSSRELMDRALDPYILLGMPHLTPLGLSETWLMKELGHRHWLMLARSMGLDDAGFRAGNGDDVYAAICATSLQAGALGEARPNDVLCIRSSLTPISRTQVLTNHRVGLSNRVVAEVELISTFVHHAVKGDNHSIAKIDLSSRLERPSTRSELVAVGSQLRSGSLESHLGLPTASSSPRKSFHFTPCVTQEFNGAGLLYFAEYQAIADRALASWFGDEPARKWVRRDVFFSGNARAGEPLAVELVGETKAENGFHLRIRRADRRPIADIFSML